MLVAYGGGTFWNAMRDCMLYRPKRGKEEQQGYGNTSMDDATAVEVGPLRGSFVLVKIHAEEIAPSNGSPQL